MKKQTRVLVRALVSAGTTPFCLTFTGGVQCSFSNRPAETPDDVGSALARTSACSDGNGAFLA